MNRLVMATAAASLLVPLTAYADEQVNLPPVALPDAASVTAGQSVTVPALANDTDDGLLQPLEVVATTGDNRVTFDATSVTFSASATDAGPYTFEYTVSDGELTATSTVTVTVAVKRAVSLSAPAKVVGLHRFRLNGRVSPARAVVVRLFRKVGTGAWTPAGRTTADAQGRFSFSQRPTLLARLRFRAVAGTVVSRVLERRVVARADLVVSGPLHASDVPWSYRPGCPVGPSELRRISVTHLTYDRRLRRGKVVVAASAVPAVRAMLTNALDRRFPFRQLAPTDRFYAGGRRTPTQSDLAAMRADNTSAFNCRTVTGNPYRLSQHAYGIAIDINTVRNPYVTASHVYPSFAREYLNRSHRRPGMLYYDGVVARTFRSFGWPWGARWTHPDYQHFSINGG